MIAAERNHYEISNTSSPGITGTDSQLVRSNGTAERGNPRRCVLCDRENVHAYPWLWALRHSLSKGDQERVLAEGKARSHRWAPEAGYVTFIVRDEGDLKEAMGLIRMSHEHFAGEQDAPRLEHQSNHE